MICLLSSLYFDDLLTNDVITAIFICEFGIWEFHCDFLLLLFSVWVSLYLIVAYNLVVSKREFTR